MSHPSAKPFFLTIGLIVLAVGSSLPAQTAMDVDRNMLLWKKGFDYRTQVSANIELSNTTIKVNLTDRSAAGYQPRSFLYEGAMAYTTRLIRDYEDNGSASRYYQRCQVIKSENEPLSLKVDSSFLEVWAQRLGLGDLPPEWEPHVEVTERNAEMFGGSYIVVTQKKGSPNLLGGGALEMAFQSMGELSQQQFLLTWGNLQAFQKGGLKVSPARVQDGKLVSTRGGVSPVVKDVIGRESRLLYEALLGFNGLRHKGDEWEVDGQTLDAMVHPTVSGGFQGKAMVRADAITNESPGPLVGLMNGLKLHFIPSSKAGQSNLRFVVNTVDNGTHETRLNPGDGGFVGEIWLDTDNQCVRYGKLTVSGARYDGFLPRIGDLNAKINLTADFYFKMVYQQSIAAVEADEPAPAPAAKNR